MNIAANIGAGAEALQGGNVNGAAVNGPAPQTGSMAAWKPGSAVGAGWTGNARASGSTSSFAPGESFRSSWQAMLRASGSGLRPNGEVETVGVNGEDGERAGTAAGGVVPTPTNGAMFAQAGKIAEQNGSPAAATSEPAKDELQNAALIEHNAGWFVAQSVADAKSNPVSAQSIGASSGAPLARNAGGGKPSWGTRKPGAGAQDTTAESIATDGANLAAAIQAPAAIAIGSQAAPTDLRVVPENAGSIALLNSAHGWDGGSDSQPGSAPPAGGARSASAATATANGADEPAHPSLQAALATRVAALQTVPHEDEPKGNLVTAPGAPGFAGSGQAPPPEPVGAVAAKGQINPVQSSHRAGKETSISQGTGDPAEEKNAHLGEDGNAVAAIQMQNTTPEADGWSSSSERAAIDAKDKPAAHASGAVEAGTQGTQSLSAPAGGAITDPGALAQIPSGAHQAASTPGGSATQASSAPVAPARETFAELDAGSAVGAPRWTHAADRQVEGGFEDPALGWVGVKADMSGGSVHAVLMPGTSDAAQVLGAHMAGLSAHLVEQHSQVSTLTMAHSGTGGSGAGQSMQQGAGQNQNPGSGDSAHAQWSPQTSNTEGVDMPAERTTVHGDTPEAMLTPSAIRGAHISVMA